MTHALHHLVSLVCILGPAWAGVAVLWWVLGAYEPKSEHPRI